MVESFELQNITKGNPDIHYWAVITGQHIHVTDAKDNDYWPHDKL